MKKTFTSYFESYNSDFGIDCKNNIDNCVSEPLFDDFEEISYIKKFATIYCDDTYQDFDSPSLLREEIIQTFLSKIFFLDIKDPFYGSRKQYYQNKMEEELHVVDSFEKKTNKKAQKIKFKNIAEKIIDCIDPRKTRMVIDLIDRESASIKSFAVRKREKIKVTTRFMSGKLLMFAKVSFKRFIYDIAEIFCFPTQVVAEIYKTYSTDTTTLQFIFISNPNSDLPEQKFRDIFFLRI